jgi:hypothetical protein
MVILLLLVETILAVPTNFCVDALYANTLLILEKLFPVRLSVTAPATAIVGEMEEIVGTPYPPQAAIQIHGMKTRMQLTTNVNLTLFMAVLQVFVSHGAAKKCDPFFTRKGHLLSLDPRLR